VNVKIMKNPKNKYGVQIAINSSKDGTWSVSQLVQKNPPHGPYTRKTPPDIWYIDYTKPTAATTLVTAIAAGLEGRIVGIKNF